MKNIIKIFTAVFLGTWALLSCSPEEHELEAVDVSTSELVEGIAYKIEHDPDNQNIVYLTSLMDSRYTPQWEHPQGRSQEQTVTLKIPFAGTYQVKFGVQTRGGVVYGEPVTFTVDQMHADFISDPMWSMLAGGAGQEKTWYLDLDAQGVSRKFLGPMHFFRKWYEWDGLHTAAGDNYIDSENWDWTQAIEPTLEREGESASGAPMPGVQAWYWLADWKGNQWMTPAADFGTMTFNLKDGANVIVDQQEYGLGLATGTYLLDTENKILKFTDARPLHDANRDGDDVDWSNVRILYLTEDAMQLAVVPNADNAAMVVYNYISKEYRDNWVPGEEVEPEPPYEGDPNEDLTTDVSTTKKWIIDLKYPYNWFNLAGSPLNEVKTYGDDPAGYAFTTWTPPYDATIFSSVSMSLTKAGAANGTYVIETESETYEGSYTVDENNNIDFGQEIEFFSGVGGWLGFKTTDANSLRLIMSDEDAFGNVTGIWLGARDAVKDEYLAVHFKKADAGAADPAAAWKTALAGKTFTPDVNWFIDWVNFPPDFAGGWTSAETFGDDYTSNSWVWDANVRAVAESATLTFRLEGNNLKVDLEQMKDGVPFAATGDVTIDVENKLLNFSIPLVDYAGTAASWLNTTNPKSITGSTNDWFFVSHGGSSLATIDTDGLWLGVVANSIAAGDSKDEVLIFHYVVKP